MRFLKCGVLSLVVVSLCTACWAQAQSEPSQTEIKSFVSRYVAAFNAQDAAGLESLYSSRLQACLTAEKRDYKDFYDFMLAMMWRDPIPAEYTFKVSAVNENNLKALETFGRFAVKPARELHIDYQQGDDLGTVVIYLVRENGRLVADQPCASETTMKQFRNDTPAREEHEAHYESLAAGIEEPLRSQLIALLRGHKTGEATERYMKASGQDGQTAMFVIDQLARDARR